MGRPFSEEYLAYMKSAGWRARRDAALKAAGHRCEYEYDLRHSTYRCASVLDLTVHHRTYARLGRELPEDLEVLCWLHHMLEHISQEVQCVKCGFPIWEDSEIENWLTSEVVSIKDGLGVRQMHWINYPQKNQLVDALRSLVGDACPGCASKPGAV